MLLRDLVSLQSSVVNLVEEIWGSWEMKIGVKTFCKRSQALFTSICNPTDGSRREVGTRVVKIGELIGQTRLEKQKSNNNKKSNNNNYYF